MILAETNHECLRAMNSEVSKRNVILQKYDKSLFFFKKVFDDMKNFVKSNWVLLKENFTH